MPVEALTCPKCGANVNEKDENCPSCGVSIKVLPGFGPIIYQTGIQGQILAGAHRVLNLAKQLDLEHPENKLLSIHIGNMHILLEQIANYGGLAPVYLFNQVNYEVSESNRCMGI